MNKKKLSTTISLATKDIKRLDDKYYIYAASGFSGMFCENENLKSNFDSLYFRNKSNVISGFNHAILIQNSNGKSTEFNPFNNHIYFATNIGFFSIDKKEKIKALNYENKPLYLTKIQLLKNKLIGISISGRFYEIDVNHSISELKLPKTIAKEKFYKFYIYENLGYFFSENGIFEYDFETQKAIKVLSLGNNLDAYSVVLNNNQLYFATSKGIVIRNRNKISKQISPKMVLNNVFVNGKKRNLNALTDLNPLENEVSIHFSTLSFLPNQSYSIFYKINDGDWNSMDESTKNLKLSSLSPGQYNVQLGINFKNKIHDVQIVKFNICKPFWLSNLFIISMILIFFLLFYAFYQYQIQKIKKQNQLLLEKNQLEINLNLSALNAIKSQMNPHFFYNALNTIQSFILSNDKKQALHYLSKFASLTRNILEMSDKEFVTIAEEIETITLYLDIEQARFEKDFEYKIITENIEDAYLLKIPSMLLHHILKMLLNMDCCTKKDLKCSLLFFISQKTN
jgi:hypothetical protein